MIPRIIFRNTPIEETILVIQDFLSEKSQWKEIILEVYPDLREKLINSKDQEETINNFFIKTQEKYKPFFGKIKEDFQSSWDKINDKIMIALSEIHEIKWPDDFKDFTARITLNPICPRYLQHNMFDLYFGLADMTMKSMVIHEVSHFIFFEKFKEVYPDIDSKEFESPYLAWKLSEIVPFVILNDKKIQDILEHEPLIYDYLRKIEINNKRIIDYFKEFYDKRNGFSDFLKKSYEFIKLHEKEL